MATGGTCDALAVTRVNLCALCDAIYAARRSLPCHRPVYGAGPRRYPTLRCPVLTVGGPRPPHTTVAMPSNTDNTFIRQDGSVAAAVQEGNRFALGQHVVVL